MRYELSYSEKEILRIAIQFGRVGVSQVRGACRCGDDRARYVLRRLMQQGYLLPSKGGGFRATGKAIIEAS